VGIEHSHQVHDLPEVHIKVSQHDVYRVRCACGTEYLGSLPAEVSAAPACYGVNLKTLVGYLLVYKHVPVQRCVQLIADLCDGTGPTGGVGHGMPTRCATAVAEVVTLIKTLITMAYVVGFDETTLRCGPAGQKKYVPSASTENATTYHLGGRDLDSLAEAGILPELPAWPCMTATATASIAAGGTWRDIGPAPLICRSDFADAEKTYPDAHWPARAVRARGLIAAWHHAREADLAESRFATSCRWSSAAPSGSACPRATGARAAPQHRAASRAGNAGVLLRPRQLRSPLLHRHPDLAREQHQ
jgi:transposase